MLIRVSTKTVRLDPSLMVYEVELHNDDGGVWKETYGSRFEVKTFLRGVEAGYNLISGGFLYVPFITSHSDETTESYTKDPE
jgi:hypothetical protein